MSPLLPLLLVTGFLLALLAIWVARMTVRARRPMLRLAREYEFMARARSTLDLDEEEVREEPVRPIPINGVTAGPRALPAPQTKPVQPSTTSR